MQATENNNEKKLGIFLPFYNFYNQHSLHNQYGMCKHDPPGRRSKDSLPPVLLEATPKDSTTQFTGNRVILNFDEFVEIQNAYENVLVSPTPNNVPNITARFRTVTVRIKDTLEPNTTYSINFGNGLRDINEGNIATNFTYVFSTGNKLDTNSLSGRVILAETGKIDTTLIVVLHRNLADSAVAKDKPRYIAKLDGKGFFRFSNLADGTFALYAIPNDYSKHYDDTTKPFAFTDKPLSSTDNTPVTLYAYALPKIDTVPAKARPAQATPKAKEDKQLRVSTNLDGGKQDLLKNLEISFNKKITKFDSARIHFLGPDLNVIPNYKIVRDTNQTRFTFLYTWPENTPYRTHTG